MSRVSSLPVAATYIHVYTSFAGIGIGTRQEVAKEKLTNKTAHDLQEKRK